MVATDPLTFIEPVMFVCCVPTPFFSLDIYGGPPELERTTNILEREREKITVDVLRRFSSLVIIHLHARETIYGCTLLMVANNRNNTVQSSHSFSSCVTWWN